MQRRLYRNPPIEEAVCTFRFEPGAAPVTDLDDHLHQLIRTEFARREEAKQLEARLTVGRDGPTHDVRILDETVFSNEGRTMYVHVGPNVLSIRYRKPYEGWERFWLAIWLAYQSYREVAAPKMINGISLRYVNRLEIAPAEAGLSHYFNFYPHWHETLPAAPDAFMMAVQFQVPDSPDVLRIHMGSVGRRNGHLQVVLDLEVFFARSPSLALDDAEDWLQRAHSQVVAAFEGCIREPLRERFDSGEVQHGGGAGASHG